jgi:hypothetical protein
MEQRATEAHGRQCTPARSVATHRLRRLAWRMKGVRAVVARRKSAEWRRGGNWRCNDLTDGGVRRGRSDGEGRSNKRAALSGRRL